MQAKIHLKNITVETLIGLRAQERLQKQPLIFDLLLTYGIEKAVQTDHIDQTVDYSKVVQALINWVQDSKYILLETLGVKLAQKLCQKFPLKEITLKIQKPHALKDLANVTFEYTLKT